MKIVDYVKRQCECMKCIFCEEPFAGPASGDLYATCPKDKDTLCEGDVDTCGAWYLELTRPANPELIGDKEHTLIAVYDFPSWLNLYQCPKPSQIRVLSREEWPEVKE